MENIMISVENLSISAELNNTPTAQKIYEILPIEGMVHVWSDATLLKTISDGAKIRINNR